MIKQYSVALLVALALFSGCKSGNDDDTTTTTDTNTFSNVKDIQNIDLLSDAEKLALAAVSSSNTAQQSNQPDNQNSRSRALYTESESCPNGGIMKTTIDDAIFNQNMDYNSPIPMTMTYIDCVEDDFTTNGKMKIVMNHDDSGSVEFLTDFTDISPSENVLVKQGSKISYHIEGDWEVAIINATIMYNGLLHAGENLIYKSKELSNGNYIDFPVSGKEKIGDSAYFTVDPNYDASQTPFTTDTNDDLISGTVKYIDMQNHQVVLKITEKNTVTVKVDNNGNHLFSDDEISVVSIP